MSFFLDKSSIKEPDYKVNGKKPKYKLYNDDTIKEVLIKLAIQSGKGITSDHIFAWIKQRNHYSSYIIYLSGFEY